MGCHGNSYMYGCVAIVTVTCWMGCHGELYVCMGGHGDSNIYGWVAMVTVICMDGLSQCACTSQLYNRISDL